MIDTVEFASHLDLHLEIYNEGRFDTRDDSSFQIVNFPFLCSKIPAASVYGVYISRLIRHYMACFSYLDFLHRVCCSKGNYWILSSIGWSFTDKITSWLIVMWNLCHRCIWNLVTEIPSPLPWMKLTDLDNSPSLYLYKQHDVCHM